MTQTPRHSQNQYTHKHNAQTKQSYTSNKWVKSCHILPRENHHYTRANQRGGTFDRSITAIIDLGSGGNCFIWMWIAIIKLLLIRSTQKHIHLLLRIFWVTKESNMYYSRSLVYVLHEARSSDHSGRGIVTRVWTQTTVRAAPRYD